MSNCTNQFPNLLKPITIGKTTFKNRMAVAPMGGAYGNLQGPHGEYSDAALEYFLERARGGFGIIFGGALYPDNQVDPFDPSFSILDHEVDFMRAGLRLNEKCGFYGTKIIQQVSVGLGRNYEGLYSCSENEVWGNPEKTSPVLTKDQIKKKIDCTVRGAELMKKSGFAGVEIHAMHWGYLLDQFTMAITNHRLDEYGGNLENRMRICKEIAEGVRQTCGDNFVLSMRMGLKSYISKLNNEGFGENDVEAGRTLEESIKIAKMLEEYGYDLINADVGVYDTFYYAAAPMYMPQGHVIPLAAEVKKNVNIPILCGSRMNDPEMGERAIAEGKIDGVVLGRPSMADPYYAKKIQMGVPEKIRPCLGCNTCIYSIFDGGEWVHCAVNPILQRETYYHLGKAEVEKKVAVIGGGVAGMEAARSLKLRGHEVTIYEKSDHLGGLLIPAGSHEFKKEIKQLVEWYEGEIKALNIPVEFNVTMDAQKAKELGVDAIVFATGSAPVVPPIEGKDHPKCKTGVEVLTNHPELGKKLVVVGGGLVGCETAIDYAMQGLDVTVVEGLDEVLAGSPMISPSVRQMIPDLMKKYNVKKKTGYMIHGVNDEGAVVVPSKGGDPEVVPADTVVLSIGMRAIPTFEKELEGSGIETYSVGDATRAGNVYTCIHSAYDVARTI